MPHHIRSASNPSTTEYVVKVFSNWETIVCWCTILLQDSFWLDTSLTQLWNKPRLKHVQISNVIDKQYDPIKPFRFNISAGKKFYDKCNSHCDCFRLQTLLGIDYRLCHIHWYFVWQITSVLTDLFTEGLLRAMCITGINTRTKLWRW
jgi:hypothetical protein